MDDADLLRALSEEQRARVSTPAAERALVAAIHAGKTAWSTIDVPVPIFAVWLCARVPPPPAAFDPSTLLASDLYLACACARGDATAIAELDRLLSAQVAIVFAKVRPRCGLDEAKQLVRTRLLVAEVGELPRIALYGGRGALAHWVRVTASRTLLNAATAQPKEDELSESMLGKMHDASATDAEGALVKERFGGALKDAFAKAAALLTARERTLLRYATCDDLTVDEIGALYGVHRATAARWVSAAREALESKLRAILRDELQIAPDDMKSVVRVMAGAIDLSLSRHFPRDES